MKISIKQILSESVSFYKGNFKNLIGLSFVILIYTILMLSMEYTPTILTNHTSWLLLYIFIIFGLLIPMMILLPKIYLAIPILIDALLGENKLTTIQAYRQTKGKYWLMVWCSLLVGILYVPLMALTLYAKIPFAAPINQIYISFIAPLFYTLIPMIAIEPRTNRYLRKSIKMIKGNYINVFILNSITLTLITAIHGTLSYIFQGKTAVLLIFNMVYAIAYFFIYPFASTVTVIVYRQLRGSQELFD